MNAAAFARGDAVGAGDTITAPTHFKGRLPRTCNQAPTHARPPAPEVAPELDVGLQVHAAVLAVLQALGRLARAEDLGKKAHGVPASGLAFQRVRYMQGQTQKCEAIYSQDARRPAHLVAVHEVW